MQPTRPVAAERHGPVAFVLSGGASHGAIQAGMVAALYERGIVPDLIVAASVGAFNAAFLASRPTTVATVEELARVWTGLRRGEVFPTNPVTGALGFFGQQDYLVSHHGLRTLVGRWLEFERLEEAPVPLSVMAADLLSGTERLLSTGPAMEALLASAAIPGVFPPVCCEGRWLVDGGVAANTPISAAVAAGARTVYVLPTGYSCALRQPPHGALAVAAHALTLLIQRQLVADIRRVPESVRLVVLPPPCPLTVPPTDFGHAAELIDRARADAEALLPYLDKDENQPHVVPAVMRQPHHDH